MVLKKKKENKKISPSEKKTYTSFDLIMILILFILILDLQIFGLFGRTTFLQDQTIIFEGGYRISQGQIPYQDFFMPLGPVVFYMQAFFNFIFGTNIISMAMHGFFLSVIICILFYLIVRKEFNSIISFFFAFFLYLSFQGLSFHAFYNYSTYFFFFLNVFLLFVYLDKDKLPEYVYLTSALLAAIDFYTKQDTGLLHLFFLLVYFSYNYRKDYKSIFFLYIIPSIIFFAGTFFLLSEILPNFPYWFNLGQSPHNSRLSELINPEEIVNIFTSWKIYFIVVFMILIFLKKIKELKKIKILGLFLVISITTTISNISSGSTRQLSVMGIPVLIFFLWILIKDYLLDLTENHKTSIKIILVLILLWSVNPIPTYGLIFVNYLNPNISHISEGCYNYYLMSNSNLKGLEKIKEIIENNNKDFVSITEYSFLYCDYNLNPPKNLPLWFDEGISFYKENIQKIIQTIASVNPKVILIQDAHGHEDKALNNKFIETFISLGYRKEIIINNTVSSGPITILVKNENTFNNTEV